MMIFKKFTFDSAHSLPNVPDGHKCKAVHGHTYQLTIYIENELVENLDWVMDFAVVLEAVPSYLLKPPRETPCFITALLMEIA